MMEIPLWPGKNVDSSRSNECNLGTYKVATTFRFKWCHTGGACVEQVFYQTTLAQRYEPRNLERLRPNIEERPRYAVVYPFY